MSRFEAWMLHLSNLLVGGTGLVYAWMVFLAEPADPYAVVNHPLQPQLQHLHILLAPLLVFTAGLVWRRHVWSQWKRGIEDRRRSGLSMIFLLVPMIVSGYLIQTATGGEWRRIWVWVHLATSGLWLLGYLAHQVPVIWQRLASPRLAPEVTSGSPPTSDNPPAEARPLRFPETSAPKAAAAATPRGAGPRGDR
jgi:hypothetical protein